MFRTLIALLVVLFAMQTLHAQEKSFKEKFDEAQGYLKNENFEEALPILLELYKADENNANLAYRVGYCYLQSPTEKSKAAEYLEKSEKAVTLTYDDESHKETGVPPYVYSDLADAYHYNYRFDEAIALYKKYREMLYEDNAEELNLIDRKLEICDNAILLMNTPVRVTIDNVGADVNTQYPEYAPVVTADEQTMIFTSRREGSTGDQKTIDGKYFEDIYITKKVGGQWGTPVNLGEPINTADHEATIGLSVDGQRLIIYRYADGEGGLYESYLDGEIWTEPKKLGSDINDGGWNSHGTLNAMGDMLCFTSDRPEGFGGRDIYFAKRLPNGEWGLVQNFGPNINTIYDEGSPYLHPDGRTLFFSSKGHNTMGGHDIFMSVLDENGEWGKPTNIGYPVNTTGDDVFYIPSADGKRAYYSSFKDGGQGEQDVYLLTFPEAEEKGLTVLKGSVTNTRGEIPQGVIITVFDPKTGDIVGEYAPNSSTGDYLFILPPGMDFDVDYEADGHLFHSLHLDVPKGTAYNEIHRAVTMHPLIIGSVLVLNNLYFEYDKDVLLPESAIELEKVYHVLNDNPEIKVEIGGHTDSKGRDAYNMKLSQKRADAVVRALVEKGIAADRMTAQGYGETKHIAPNEHPDGTDNPEGRQKNRRTELIITEVSPIKPEPAKPKETPRPIEEQPDGGDGE